MSTFILIAVTGLGVSLWATVTRQEQLLEKIDQLRTRVENLETDSVDTDS